MEKKRRMENGSANAASWSQNDGDKHPIMSHGPRAPEELSIQGCLLSTPGKCRRHAALSTRRPGAELQLSVAVFPLEGCSSYSKQRGLQRHYTDGTAV